MPYVMTEDGTRIFYKDWGQRKPIVFHHGWPLSADDWDTQNGHNMDHYDADAAGVVDHLAPCDAMHIGHSTREGEVTRYVARHGKSRVAKAILRSALPPIMVKTPSNADGLPIEVFDELSVSLNDNRARFYREVASDPFCGFDQPGAKALEGVIANWWRQGRMGGAKGIKAYSESDFAEDLKAIDVPTLVMHGDDDQIVTYKDAALFFARLLNHATLKIYPGMACSPPGPDVINEDLLAFIEP
jgi:non-heme chloroperoxidase